VDGTWAGANWSSSPVPGSADTATFQNAGNGHTTIDLGSGVTVKSITFDNTGGLLAPYTIGAGGAGNQTLTLTQNGSAITVNSNVTNNQLFNSNVVLGTSAAGNSAYSITNNGASSTLTIAGGVSGGTTGNATLNVNGTGTVNVSGSISKGSSAAFALGKSSTGTLILSGANSYTGATTVTAGALNLQNNSALGTVATTGSTASVTVSTGAALQLQGGISTTTAVPLNLNGTGVTASPNGALENVSGSNTYSGLITTQSASTIGSDAGTLTLTGGISSGTLLTFIGAGNTTVNTTAISGAGGLALSGTGTVTLAAANTYTGTTAVNSGTLAVGANAPVSSAGALGNASTSVALGTTTAGAGAVAILTNGAYEIDRSITETTSATNTSLSLGGNQASGTSLYTGNITLKENTTLTSAAGGEVDFTGSGTNKISGTVNLVIDGGGTVKLGSTGNTFGGTGNTITIQNGTTLLTGNTGNLGSASNGIVFNNGVVEFVASSAYDLSGRTLTFNLGGATINTNGNAVTFAFAVGNGGTGGLTLNDTAGTPGSLLLSAAASYGGATNVKSGTLKVGVGNALPTATVLTIGGTGTSGTLDLGGNDGASSFNQQVSGLATAGTAANQTITDKSSGTGTATLTVNNDASTSNADFTFGGLITDGPTAHVALTKTGSRALTVTDANTYSGGTIVKGGTLYVNNTSGSGTGTGNVTVGSGDTANSGTLAGSGNIGNTTTRTTVSVTGGGTIASGAVQTGAPGVVTGTGLTFTNTTINVQGDAPATLSFALGTNTTAGTGAYNFANPSTNSTYLTLASGSTLNFAGVDAISLTDLTSSATLALRQGVPYLLVAAASGSDSAFTGLVTEQGFGATGTLSLDGNGYVLGVYNGSGPLTNYTPIAINQYGADGATPLSGSNIYAAPALYLDNGDLEVVPEPGTWALMLGGLALLVLIQRRRVS
jgi:autotransporter-associated beta strand protein